MEADILDQLYSDQARNIKEALDYLTQHRELAWAHRERIQSLKEYAAIHTGLTAIQVEVAAIVLWNHLHADRSS